MILQLIITMPLKMLILKVIFNFKEILMKTLNFV